MASLHPTLLLGVVASYDCSPVLQRFESCSEVVVIPAGGECRLVTAFKSGISKLGLSAAEELRHPPEHRIQCNRQREPLDRKVRLRLLQYPEWHSGGSSLSSRRLLRSVRRSLPCCPAGRRKLRVIAL
ncbi:hypothetical protein L596_018801 [Steinernema carpocapsae]|uniref:Uncharacterized protein n=1 Tax=Steinernema carpocapsae TaxID=34508 RepID=A0A4U5N6U5_STECR|nr:hypothetical protein L596_018801 [Steinernema carpocapsae]